MSRVTVDMTRDALRALPWSQLAHRTTHDLVDRRDGGSWDCLCPIAACAARHAGGVGSFLEKWNAQVLNHIFLDDACDELGLTTNYQFGFVAGYEGEEVGARPFQYGPISLAALDAVHLYVPITQDATYEEIAAARTRDEHGLLPAHHDWLDGYYDGMTHRALLWDRLEGLGA